MFDLMLLMTAAAAAMLPSPDAPSLAAERLYVGVGRPVPIVVTGPVEPTIDQVLSLVLMDEAGTALLPAVTVESGHADLADLCPDIWRIRRACYLQLMVGEDPAGSALVLQPMLSRLVPITIEDVNPNGIRYTRITGWYDELHPPAEGPPAEGAARDDAAGEESAEEPPSLIDDPAQGERLFTGLRIYPERDVLLRTSLGEIRLAMRPDHAPNTVWNFLRLCEGGFYQDVVFHRIVPLTRAGDPFVIQAGDPTGTGNGGPGFWLPMEPSALPHDFGVISMARDVDPDSAGSQIFICLSRAGTARLDGHYCAFGSAVEGAETIRAIADVELADVATGRPQVPPVILEALLVPAPPRRPDAGRPDRALCEPAPEPAEPPAGPKRVPR